MHAKYFLREEKNGVHILVPLKGSAQSGTFFLNKTGVDILQLRETGISPAEIVKKLKKRYPDVENKLILYDVFRMLSKFDSIEIVRFGAKERRSLLPVQKPLPETLYIPDEEEFHEYAEYLSSIFNAVYKNGEKEYLAFTTQVTYDPESFHIGTIRAMNFYNVRNIFGARKHDGGIDFVVGINLQDPTSMYIILNLIVARQTDNQSLMRYARYMKQLTEQYLSPLGTCALRCVIPEPDQIDSPLPPRFCFNSRILYDFLGMAGFRDDFVMKYELGPTLHAHVFTKTIREKDEIIKSLIEKGVLNSK